MSNGRTMDNTWRSQVWGYGTVSDHAQRFAMRLEKAGLEVRSTESGEPRLSWPEVVQAFADAAEDAVDQHVRHQREKAEYSNAHEGPSEAPEEQSETPHRNIARSLIIRFVNGAEEITHMHHPMIQQHGWAFRSLNGIPYLVIGHGVPRRQYPLCNIAFIELSQEEL